MQTTQFSRKLKLFISLYTKGSIPKKETARIWQITERTLERYIKEFRAFGMIIYFENGFYHLKDDGLQHPIPLFTIDIDEAEQLWHLAHSLEDGSPIRKIFHHRLQDFFEVKSQTKFIVNYKKSENIKMLQKAIHTEKQVLLKSYKSAYSNKTRDRLVEPIHFTTNYKVVVCFEVNDQLLKHFSTARIDSVELLEGYQFKNEHKHLEHDVFGIHSEEKYPVKLKLSLRAKHLLIEEYPESEPYIKGRIFKTNVNGFEGVGRFVLGLYEDIEVLESEELKEFLRKKIQKMKSKY
jgi:predicted DNA-binding transcriptional regulator YafY